MESKEPVVRTNTESCDEEELFCALNCLEATADVELAHESGVVIRSPLSASKYRASIAEEMALAQYHSSEEEYVNQLESPAWSQLTSPQHAAMGRTVEQECPAPESLENVAARRIQHAWREHRRVNLPAADNSSERVNPFSSTTTSKHSSLRTSRRRDPSAGSTDTVVDEDSSSHFGQTVEAVSHLDPTHKMAAVAAQLWALESHEQHVAEIIKTVPSSSVPPHEQDPASEEETELSEVMKAKLLAPSMKICFSGTREHDLASQLPGSGRESRGAGDGASSGSPVATDDERSDTIRSPKTSLRGLSVVTKTVSSHSTVSRESVEGASDVTATATSERHHAARAASATPPVQPLPRKRAGQMFDERLLSTLSEQHLQSLKEEFENEVQMMSEQLINNLTERDKLVSDREEYNRLFRHYSKINKAPTYRQDSAITRPDSFQPPSQPSKDSPGSGLLSRTRNALISKLR